MSGSTQRVVDETERGDGLTGEKGLSISGAVEADGTEERASPRQEVLHVLEARDISWTRYGLVRVKGSLEGAIVARTELLTNLCRFVADMSPDDGAPGRDSAAETGVIFQETVMLTLIKRGVLRGKAFLCIGQTLVGSVDRSVLSREMGELRTVRGRWRRKSTQCVGVKRKR
eukprot:scaffold35321_cov37-Prasinocladus_malaysianus.AAC.1